MKPTTTTTAAPDLATLHAQVEAAYRAYPELRQGLGAALAQLRRALGEPALPRLPRDRRRVDGLR